MSHPERSSGKALVTGAGGFIGRHLTAEIAAQGGRVVGLDQCLERVRELEALDRVELIAGDFVQREVQERVLDGVDTVYHLAAVHLGVSAPRREFWRVNVEGVRSLAERAARAGVRRFVHCSSVGVYGRIEETPADEESPCRPKLPYERSKLAGERAVLQSIAQHGLAAVILRPAWVYGPGCPRTEKLFRAIARGRFLVAGRGLGLRHCVYVRDMVEAFRLAAVSDAALGQVIVVGDACAVTIRNLVDEIARLTGARPPRSIPLPVLEGVALVVEAASKPLGREPPISRRTLEFFRSNTSFRIDRARRLLGFEPRYDLASGLAETHHILFRETCEPWPDRSGARRSGAAGSA